MVSPETRKKYSPTIGIECHVQLKTKTKLFSAVTNDAREAPPNVLISHIDLGMPGALPVLNEQAIYLATKAAFALGTKPQHFSKFDRKHYFYPDLPKGYQITQFDKPIIVGGHVDIVVDGKTKRINLTRAHLEEDAGKSTHPAGKDYSLVDLNRVGTPLLEIVSEPEMHSPAEAKAYAKELYLLMRYADVSDANLYYGNMRFDVNVSVSQHEDKLGTRSETKNLNSFRSVEKAVEHEIIRQIELLEKGQKIVQETRGWDEAKQKTVSQRSKEDAHDYRYMPEPDIPPVELDKKYIEKIGQEMPDLPDDYRQILNGVGIDASVVGDIVNTPALARTIRRIYEAVGGAHAKRVAFWLLQEQPEDVSIETGLAAKVDDAQLIKLSRLVEENKLSSTAAKQVLSTLQAEAGDALKVAEKLNLLQVSDEDEIARIVTVVLKENPKAEEDIKNGETKAIGFLVGQVMKASKGQANPELAQRLIKKQLRL